MVGSIYILCRWLKFLLEAKLKLAIWKLYIESIRNSLCSQVHCTSQPKQQQSGLSLKVGSSPGHCELDPCQLSWETDHRTSQPKQQQSGLSQGLPLATMNSMLVYFHGKKKEPKELSRCSNSYVKSVIFNSYSL